MKRIFALGLMVLIGVGACVGPMTHDTAREDCACARERGGATGPCPSCGSQYTVRICGHCDCPPDAHSGCC